MDIGILVQIFVINLSYIMLNTLRVLLTMRGYRRVAPIISIVEISIYTIGLSMVMQYLDRPIYLATYAIGYGIGIYIGMLLEDKIALGYSVIQIFETGADHSLAESLRQRGYGVTVQSGYGREGNRLILTVLTPRANERDLCRTIEEIDHSAFYISYDAKYIHGGYWTKRVNPLKIRHTIKRDDQLDTIPVSDVTTKHEYIGKEEKSGKE